MGNIHKGQKYRVLGAAVGINLLAGILYIWSVISKSLISELNWTSKEASLPYTISTLCFVIAMVIFGKIQDAKGPSFTATIGSILMGSGLILSGFTKSPLIMLITIGAITGPGIGIINVSTAPPAVKWFPPEKKGIITGIVVSGVGISSIIFSPLSNYLLSTVGISKTFIYLGVGALFFAFIFAQMLKNPPEGYNTVATNKLDKTSLGMDLPREDSTWREMLKTKEFYKLWVMLAFSSSAGLMIIGHISNIAKIQVNWESGFLLVIFLAVFNTLGRILGGSISDKIGCINLMRIMFALQGLNMFFFPKYLNIWLVAFGVAIAGLCYGAGFPVFPAKILDLYGAKDFGLNYGLIFTSWGIGGVIGPMTGAAIFDLTGSYNNAFLIAFLLLAISLAITFTFKTNMEKCS